MSDDQCDCVSVVEVACDWAAEPDRPAVGSAIPQFMTNWLGSYMPVADADVVTLMLPTVVP